MIPLPLASRLEVGRTPWSAADALVGLLRGSEILRSLREACGGPAADQGVRPTESSVVP
jgi:hypothetical protein